MNSQNGAFTAISTSDAHSITVRGMDLCSELIGKVGFTEYFFLLLTGARPSADQLMLLDALLVSIAEHGLVPSNQAARMTLAAAPDALQGAVAAGILGCGSVVLGSSEACGRFLAGLVARAEAEGRPAREVALEALRELRAAKRPVPGYGHPQHSGGDPRAERLLALARERGVAGAHVAMLEAVAGLIPEVYGRSLPINVSGAIPAVALDIGFPLDALKGIPILARTASLIAHLHEEMARPIGFKLSGRAAEAVSYDGPPSPPAAQSN
ncbi:citryl-CoA lyase [Propylenella binzhouense]|uniref:citrate synthase (unknown stereospecificity) n=1 Tax=Propylenella binzhouense TaxID=2555902 RepID=A0A964WUH5_9HYPH|nr:citryl-CoA lyase [Propylenella binzhouense]MYZ49132.1 citryl-CoA lyase [Propylenella binzhouense]